MVTVSAPGKIHLMGEHAVVYGKPALLAAIDKRLYVSVAQKGDQLKVVSDESADYIYHALSIVQNHFKLSTLPGIEVRVTSSILPGYHLGSSAAVAVAVIGACLYFLKKVWNPTLINQLAYEAEKKAHGNPSGGDNTTCTFGGFIWYRKELPFLKNIWQLPMKLSAMMDHFYLVDTGKPKETTGEMVAYVSEKLKVKSEKLRKLFEENEEQTKRIAVALKDSNEKELTEGIKAGEKTLEEIGVVSKKIIPIIRSIEKKGGAAKILGGGGKSSSVGYLLCYHHDKNAIEASCRPYRYKIEKITLGEEGVRLESKSTNQLINKLSNLKMNIVTVRAPGKLMLLGEHAVVYGYHCIVTTVNRYLTVRIQKSSDRDIITVNPIGDDRLVNAAIEKFRKKFDTSEHLQIETESDITGFGLGSSAAVLVAMIKGLGELFRVHLTNDVLFQLSYDALRSEQPRASGFDIASCIWGGTILFDGKSKYVTPLTVSLLPFVVSYSGVKANTIEMVEKVEKSRKSRKGKVKVDTIFSEIGELVVKGREVIVKNDWESLGELFNKNHSLLVQLGVNTEKIDTLIREARRAGAWGAKLSGAGGGDCIIALVPPDKKATVEKALMEAGGEVLDVKTGVGGAQRVNF